MRLPHKTVTKNRRAMLHWFKRHEPFIYKVATKRLQLVHNRRKGLGADETIPTTAPKKSGWTDIFSSLTSTITELAPAYLQAKQQKEIMDMQLKRAQQGLPPANVEDYTPAIKISPQISADTEKAIERMAVKTVESGAQKMLIPLGLGILLLMGMKQRRR